MKEQTTMYAVLEKHNDKVGISNFYNSKIHATAVMQEMIAEAMKSSNKLQYWTDVTDKNSPIPHCHLVDGNGGDYMITIVARTVE